MYRKILIFWLLWLGMAVSADAARRFTLVIDAGHGGRDAGAVGTISKEKNLTLKHAKAFGRMVEQNCPDVRVVYTRTDDRFVELWQRAEIANKAKADLFISIHINALPKGKIARGYQTYALGRSRRDGNRTGYIENLEVAKRENAVILFEKDYQQHYEGFDPNSPESNILFELIQDKNMENSVQLAKFMQRYVCAATGRHDLGVHQDNLAVLRLTSMPACLLELGFISTPDEERYMNSEAGAYAYARGIYNAFVAYRNKVQGIKVPFKPGIAPASEQESAQAAPAAAPSAGQPAPQPAPATTTVAPRSGVSAQVSTAAPSAALLSSPSADADTDAPVFKVQILVGTERLRPNDRQFKGLTGVESFREGRMLKYTVGHSTDYNEIYQLRKRILNKFPQSFIIAFRGTEKMDVNQAIREFRSRKNKK
jgi:N-acetylmuramoyl-L-alanine amidase